MAIALTADAREYILKAEQELISEEQTVFLICPLTGRQRAKLRDMEKYSDPPRVISFTRPDGSEIRLPIPENADEIALERCKIGLVGWRNLKYPSGAECPFTDDKEENLNRLTDAIISELQFEIESLSRLTEAEVGN